MFNCLPIAATTLNTISIMQLPNYKNAQNVNNLNPNCISQTHLMPLTTHAVFHIISWIHLMRIADHFTSKCILQVYCSSPIGFRCRLHAA